MKALDVYAGKPNALEAQFPGAEVAHMSIEDIDLARDFYDVVYCSHALPTIDRAKVPSVVDSLRKCLKAGGELWLITPSLEWAAGQVLANEPNPLAQVVLFGLDIPSRTGYTLLWLRSLVENAGMITRRAFQGPYTIRVNEEDVQLPQNVVIAMRYDVTPEPAVA